MFNFRCTHWRGSECYWQGHAHWQQIPTSIHWFWRELLSKGRAQHGVLMRVSQSATSGRLLDAGRKKHTKRNKNHTPIFIWEALK